MDNRGSTTMRKDEASAIITSGKISSAVWFLAWPTIVNTLIQMAYGIINRMFLGRLGEQAAPSLAAAGAGERVLLVQYVMMLGVSVGTSALVARFLGAENYDDAEEAARQSIILSTLGGIITMIPIILFANPFVKLIGTPSEVVPLATQYTVVIAYFSVPMFLTIIITAALRSAGDVRSPLYAGAIIIGLNILLDWLLIFGVGPFPMLGIIGAALATGISRLVGMVVILWFFKRSVLGDALTCLKAHTSWFIRIANIGWPASLQNLIWATSSISFWWILGRLPNATDAQAALTIGLAIESLAYMPGIAYSMAATPLVGQNIGAGRIDRAEHSAWIATWQAVAVISSVAIFFLIIPEYLARAFTSDISVIPLVVLYLQINAIAQPTQGIGFVLKGALQGAGDTRIPMLISLIANWIIRLPLAYLFAITLDLGAMGAWIAMSISASLNGVLSAIWFKWGTWRTLEV